MGDRTAALTRSATSEDLPGGNRRIRVTVPVGCRHREVVQVLADLHSLPTRLQPRLAVQVDDLVVTGESVTVCLREGSVAAPQGEPNQGLATALARQRLGAQVFGAAWFAAPARLPAPAGLPEQAEARVEVHHGGGRVSPADQQLTQLVRAALGRVPAASYPPLMGLESTQGGLSLRPVDDPQPRPGRRYRLSAGGCVPWAAPGAAAAAQSLVDTLAGPSSPLREGLQDQAVAIDGIAVDRLSCRDAALICIEVWAGIDELVTAECVIRECLERLRSGEPAAAVGARDVSAVASRLLATYAVTTSRADASGEEAEWTRS